MVCSLPQPKSELLHQYSTVKKGKFIIVIFHSLSVCLFKLLLFFFVLSAELPSIIKAYNTSSSSINVTWGWDPADNKSENSISGYKLTYRESNKTNETFHLLCALNFSMELTNLEVFTEYCIEIASFNNDSVGNRSHCLPVTTDEEREQNVRNYKRSTDRNINYIDHL